ncbi:MAG: sigma-70 family RNA polymerase sigma factor [Pirellulaceae bacterium]|nr:sigma-70 family RNA polymerase sigma factor [Pirellulaceae bacterium]
MCSQPRSRVSDLVEHFFRHEYGRSVSVLVKSFGTRHIEQIEDAIQSAMGTALRTWAKSGVPDNASAWLVRTARNSLIDHLRRDQVGDTVLKQLAKSEQDSPAPTLEEILDDELRMLFICCNNGLSPKTQLVLALKILCGFSIKEIALRLFSNEETIRKRVTRGREQLRELAPELESPNHQEMKSRIDSVLHVIYVLFNEGYSSSKPDKPIRRELCQEALRLGKILCEHQIATRNAWALQGLMHFHHARFDSRLCDKNGLIFLEQQDRSQWDLSEIQIGMKWLMKSGNTQPFSRYQIEAAIQLEHVTATSFEETNWEDISLMYKVLDKVHPTPLNTLNRAIAVAQWKGADEGLSLLDTMSPPGWLKRYYLWDAVLGELCRRCGYHARARECLKRAKENAPTKAEKNRIQGWLDLCQALPKGSRRS